MNPSRLSPKLVVVLLVLVWPLLMAASVYGLLWATGSWWMLPIAAIVAGVVATHVASRHLRSNGVALAIGFAAAALTVGYFVGALVIILLTCDCLA